MSPGGAQRAALNIARAATAVECIVISETTRGELSADPAAAGVIALTDGELGGRATRIARLRRALRVERPDLAVSMLSPMVTAAAARLSGVPAMHWVQAPPSRTGRLAAGGATAVGIRLAARGLGTQLAAVAGAAPGLLDELAALGVPRRKLHLLPNPIVLPPLAEPGRSGRRVVSIGRLATEKRHDLTMEALRIVRAAGHDVDLHIFGTGPLENELRALARRLGLDGHVHLHGFVERPAARLEAGDVFVLSSDYEGFGNVIVEALARGVPVIATDVPHGPRFLLGEPPVGRLVPPGSAEGIAVAIAEVLETSPPGERERQAARSRAEEFADDRVAARFEEIVRVVTL